LKTSTTQVLKMLNKEHRGLLKKLNWETWANNLRGQMLGEWKEETLKWGTRI
jgi:hypothetical protein